MAFWIYFLIIDHYLQDIKCLIPQRAEHRTFDDIFFKRKFSNYIVAESNNYDNRLISDYLLGIDAIRRQKNTRKIALIEHDLWEY